MCTFGFGCFSTATEGVVIPEEVNHGSELYQDYYCLHRIEIGVENVAKRQKLTLQRVLEMFMDPLSEDDEEYHLEEDCSDSAEFSPELDEEVPNKVTDTCNETVCST